MPKIELIHGDCMEGMKQYSGKYFDLAIVDPPYGIADNPSRHGGTGAGKLGTRVLNKSVEKFKKWDEKPSKEYFEKLFKISKNQIIWGGNYFQLPPTRGIICWNKCQPWLNFSAWEYGWTSFAMPAKLFNFDNRTGDKIHPIQKPVQLYKWLLKNYAKESDKILDTHGGSMSIAIACHDMGFDLTLYEIDKDYFEAGKKRLEEHQKQGQLFKD
jgi:site-specific DNA-methyltransferase (adenine-specific)